MTQQERRGDFPLCYGCGQDNPIGFKLQVHGDGNRTWAEFTPDQYHSGWPETVHGGVLCVLLDEVISYLPYYRFPGRRTVTGRMNIRFRRPAYTGQRLLITAHIARERSKVVEVKSAITLPDGSIVAESDGLVFLHGPDVPSAEGKES
ncbi:MAG: PaaI family thioesterase [Chloroflexota bacterium]